MYNKTNYNSLHQICEKDNFGSVLELLHRIITYKYRQTYLELCIFNEDIQSLNLLSLNI